MASAAGLLSPGLVSLVRRAQQVRLEMDENSTKGLTCKACSLEVLSCKEGSEETEHNNNNVDIIRPKSHHNHGLCQEISPNIIPLNDIEDIYENIMETESPVQYFNGYNKSPSKSLRRSLSDHHRPPLPPKKLGRSPSGEIANKVQKFEQLAKEGSPPKDDLQKGLWYYKDGLRSPSTPPPRSRSNSLSPSPAFGNSTTSLPICVQVSAKETPSPTQSPLNLSGGPGPVLEPKVITAALASSPKLFQKSEKTVSIPAAFVLTPKTSPCPTPPRTPSPSGAGPSRPPRRKTPPVPPPRSSSSVLKKLELETINNKMPDEQRVDQNLKLDEILDICADFEKQIQAEQDELKAIAQKKIAEEQNSIQFGSISFFPSTPPLPARKAPLTPLKSPTTNGINGHQWSPLNTLSPNRIKTNGSLPRERRPHELNGLSPQGDLGAMFSFDTTYSPPNTLVKNSPYENMHQGPTRGSSHSPRPQIRTILPANYEQVVEPSFGAGEDLFFSEKSKEQLYIEAKHVLNMVEPFKSNSSSSPPQTVPRKPPRSKHDPTLNVMRPPSQEAGQRVQLGTHMIKQKSPEHTLQNGGGNFNLENSLNNGTHNSSILRLEVLKAEYQTQLATVSRLKKKLNDLELRETEEINQLELERSLLNAEFDSETQKISKAKMKIALLRHKETRLSGFYEELQKEFRKKLNEAQSRISTIQEALERSPENNVQLLREQLEIERKKFEDMEFNQMEEAAFKETEREELLNEIKDLDKQVEDHENQINEIDQQQKDLLKSVRQETQVLELQRKKLTQELNGEKDKMRMIEQKLNQVKKIEGSVDEEQSEESDDESLPSSSRTNSELDARLSKLALLDKTQQEIDQISVATEKMHLNPVKFLQISNGNLKPSRSSKTDVDTLNSIGSENGSLSDSCFGSSSDLITNGKPKKIKLKTPKDPESSSGQSPADLMMSRPMSEESSMWDESESHDVRRRQNRTQQQRPLTRYLPIRNEHFDLRGHIESAGHQLDQCSHIFLSPDSCRGYLQKLSGNHQNTSAAVKSFRSKWNKRWFVFDRNKRALIYYTDKSESKAKGGVYFQSIEEVYVDHLNHVKSPNAKVTFCMKTTERTYFLMAPSPEAMRIWVDVIFTGAEGYQQFQQM